MSNMRPPRIRTTGLLQEPVQEVNVEGQLLVMLQSVSEKVDSIGEGVNAAKGQIRDFRTILLGSGEDETPHGRIPMLEATAKNHEKRIDRLEKIQIRWAAFGVAGAAFLMLVQWGLEFLFGRR